MIRALATDPMTVPTPYVASSAPSVEDGKPRSRVTRTVTAVTRGATRIAMMVQTGMIERRTGLARM